MTGVFYDPYAYEIHEDPYPAYAELRETFIGVLAHRLFQPLAIE